MKIIIAIISAGLALSACDSGTERMTAPPAEAGVQAWIVLPIPPGQVEPPMAREEPIGLSGAVDVSVDTAPTNTVDSGTAAAGGRKGSSFFHLCRAGDTIASVAKVYSMDAGAVAKLNGWSASYAPAAGMQVLLPRSMDNVTRDMERMLDREAR